MEAPVEEYEPMLQEQHVDAPAAEQLPAEHILQPDALEVPEFVTVPAYPGAQIVHAETDILPVADPVVQIPEGQRVQDVDPYEPAGHD